MNDDLNLPQRIPFTVPEGYMQQLTGKVMEKIPVDTTPTIQPKHRRHRWIAYGVAASVLAALAGTAVYVQQARHDTLMLRDANVEMAAAGMANAEGDEIEQVADYIMCDDNELYAFISDL